MRALVTDVVAGQVKVGEGGEALQGLRALRTDVVAKQVKVGESGEAL